MSSWLDPTAVESWTIEHGSDSMRWTNVVKSELYKRRGGAAGSVTKIEDGKSDEAGWMPTISTKSRVPFYVHSETGERVWSIPSGGSSLLPDGWVVVEVADGERPYYFHEEHGTSWTQPR